MNPSYSEQPMSCDFDIYHSQHFGFRELHRTITRSNHNGTIFELSLPDGISFGYYNLQSSTPGVIHIKNIHPFIRLTYTINGEKVYTIDNASHWTTAFKKQEFNYLFLPEEDIIFSWRPEQRLEIFELGVSPEFMIKNLPEEHPFFPVLQKTMNDNAPAALSVSNLHINANSSRILYDMLQCTLERKYKQLYIKSKLCELLAIELDAYQQRINLDAAGKPSRIKPIDIERVHQAREIILANMRSPCSLIDLAHQVGTNEAYLKKHFKEVFGMTVFGYLHEVKMKEAKDLLAAGKSVSEVAHLIGYTHVSHFTRAFKKHYGINPNKVKD